MNSTTSFSGTDSLPCYQQWWIDNKMGGYDGYELRSNGELKLLNYDLFLGKKWWIQGNTLFLQMITRTNPTKVITEEHILLKRESDKMTIRVNYTNMGEVEYTFETIRTGEFTDPLIGHWEGEKDQYIQIIPVNTWRYQLVVSESNTEEVEKWYGEVNSDTHTIEFEMEGKVVSPSYQRNGNREELKFNGKIYSRNCQ